MCYQQQKNYEKAPHNCTLTNVLLSFFTNILTFLALSGGSNLFIKVINNGGENIRDTSCNTPTFFFFLYSVSFTFAA